MALARRQVSKPTCTGSLNCKASATCHGDCQAQAQAKLECSPPQVNFDIEGDAALYASFQARLGDIGKAFSDTLALKDLILGSNGIASRRPNRRSARLATSGAAALMRRIPAHRRRERDDEHQRVGQRERDGLGFVVLI